MRARSGRVYLVALLGFGAVSLLLLSARGLTGSGSATRETGITSSSGSSDPRATFSPLSPSSAELPSLSPSLRQAAEALRRRDCDPALDHLAALTAVPEATGIEPSFAQVVHGLWAHACDRPELAEALLDSARVRGTALEDWRLLTLADAAAALDHGPVARAALKQALAAGPASPLYARTLEKAATVAREAGELRRALAWVERAQPSPHESLHEIPESWPVPPEVLSRLDVLSWELAEALESGETESTGTDAAGLDPGAIRRRAARRLLVRDPEQAEEIGAVEVFRRPDGTVPWPEVLSQRQLQHRARTLARVDRHEDALETLEAVAETRRTNDWRALAASILTGARRGDEALEVLAGVEPEDTAEASRLEWERARATRDLATAYRGRRNLPSSQRQELRRRSRHHLQRVAELDGDRSLTLAALRRLFLDLADDDRFDGSLAVLWQLLALDPEDTTGADFLWRRGWEAYQGRNYSSAIGYWAELASLYPQHRNTRSGRYWTGRAFEALGNHSRAQQVYRQIAASDTTDFYRKYASERLSAETPPEAAARRVPGQAPEAWPEDPRLARVRLLTDLGLDDLALATLEGLRRRSGTAGAEAFDPRAVDALESEILHRQGELRASLSPIRRAFPALGGPDQATVPERALRLYYPLAYEREVRAQAEIYRLPVHVLLGMIRQESGFDPSARSRAGARGLLQLMPATGREVARRIGLRYSTRRLADPSFNVRLGAAYLRQVLGMFDDHLELALAGYNGGPYRIKRLWRRAGRRDVDRFLEGLRVIESRIYVKRILVLSDSYRQLYDLAADARTREAATRPSSTRTR